MERDSNFELLRIVAIVMIVLLHSNYESLGGVTLTNIDLDPIGSFGRALAEQMCLIGVNLFVLISGTFGISPSIKGGLSILFQVFFFHALIVLLFLGIGEPVSLRTIAVGFYFGCPYWFITAYLVLYVLSPVLESFMLNVDQREHLLVLVAFFMFEFDYGWLTDAAAFVNGYSPISFVGLYMLARYIQRYSIKLLELSIWTDLSLYLLCSVIPVALYFLTGQQLNMLAYSSPFVIAASVFFYLAFNRMNFTSKTVNVLACSTLSIYLVHMHPLLQPYFLDFMRKAYNMLGGYWYMLVVFNVVAYMGIACILLDKLRILLWKFLCKTVVDKSIGRWNRLVNKVYSRIEIGDEF